MYEYENIELDEELNQDQMKERIDELFSILEEAKSMVEKIKKINLKTKKSWMV